MSGKHVWILLGVGSLVLGILSVGVVVPGLDDKPPQESPSGFNESINLSGSNPSGDRGEYVTIEQHNRSSLTVYGVIKGNTGGMTPIIESVSAENGTVTLNVSLEEPSKRAVTQVLTDYKYEAQLHNLGAYNTVRVEHGGEFIDSYKLEDDQKYSYTFKTPSEDGIIVDETRSVATITQVSNGSFTMEGSFVTGSSSCSKAIVQSVSQSGDTLKVELSPTTVRGEPNSTPRACTDDISSDQYRMVVNHTSNIETVSVIVYQSHEDTVRKELTLNEGSK